jgi:subtilisin family serine protease
VRLLAAAAVAAALAAPTAGAATLVQVRPAAAPLLLAAGAQRVSPQLGIWRTSQPSLVRRLRAAGLLREAEPVRRLVPMQTPPFTDPYVDREWWLTAIGVEGLTPPGVGRSVTLIDSGVDVSHEEFKGRADTTILNNQSTFARDEDHGTEVASVIGAPSNGVGIVGVYPQASLRVWDASPFRVITNADAIAGLRAAASGGPTVINLSWGSTDRDPLLEQAIFAAMRAGSLVVAASGNERMSGNPPIYPASLPHVLTVAATDEQNNITSFSSASPGLDLAAPGVDIPVADPESPTGYSLADGTSFSSPIVAGAAAWVWTARPDLDVSQLYELLRRSARDLGPPGWDPDYGFGLLDVRAALAAPTPTPDPGEPNDDVRFVKAGGVFAKAAPLVVAPKRLAGRLDGFDDPRDVFRVRVPPHRRVRVVITSTDGSAITAELWNAATTSVVGSSRNRIVRGPNVVATRGGKRGFNAYLSLGVAPGRRVDYTATLTSTAAP